MLKRCAASRQRSARKYVIHKQLHERRLSAVRGRLEVLEQRRLLSIAGGASSDSLWLARFDGLPGDSRDTQILAAQQLLSGDQDVQVVDSVGVPGIVVLETSQDVDQHALESELLPTPGFRYVEAFDPEADPASRASQFPLGPRFESDGQSSTAGTDATTLAPAISTSTALSSSSAASELTQLNGFDGMNSQVNPFGLSPPDTTGAAGPDSYIETVNIALKISNKDGTAVTPSTQFSAFFSSLGGVQNISDPAIVYNDITQRFFIGVLDYNVNSGLSRFDVAISTSSNPTTLTSSDWNFYRYNANDLTYGFDFADYPKLGYNADGYVVSFNEFYNGYYFNHSADLAIRNDGSTATGGRAVAVPGGFTNFTLAPARMHDAPSGSSQPMWFVETPGSSYDSGGNQITVVRMDNPFSVSPSWQFTNLTVNPYLYQPSPLGSRTGLGTRMYFSALRTTDGVTHLVAAHSPGELDGSGNVHSKVRWYDINVTDPSSPALYQQGVLDPGPGIDTYFPDADIAPGGAIGMTYSQSLPFYSSDPRAGVMDMYVTGRQSSDPLGTMQPAAAAKLGTAQLNAYGRAGDYSFTTVDPSDGSFWSANEYSAAIYSPNWATWIQHFRVGGLVVSGSSPANGSTVSTSPSQYVINFSEAVDPASLDASDLTVDGQPATAVTLSADQKTATFTFAVNPAPNQGLHTMAIAAGSITEQGDPTTSIAAFTASYRYDAILIQPSSTTPPTPGGVFTLPGPLTYDVTFNEPLDPASVQASDLILSGMPGATVTGVTILPGNTTAQFTIGGVTSEGTLNVAYLAGAVTDQYGNPGPGFSASYIVDYGVFPYPTPLTAVEPKGSLIYDPTQSGAIQFAGDTDSFTLSVDAGQTITLLLKTSASLQGTLDLSADSESVASATAAAAGQNVVIQTIRVPGQLGGATPPTNYTITVGGAGGSLGDYTLEVVLNAELEGESVGGASDNTTATAQDLTKSFVMLNSAGTSGVQPARGAVLGSLNGAGEATVPALLEHTDSNWGNSFPFILQPWGDSSMRYQQIYSAAAMQGGGEIDQLRFRRARFAPSFPDFQADVTVRIGYAAHTYADASSHFDDNLGAGVVTAFDGLLTIHDDGTVYPTTPFGIVINLTNDFNYDPSKGDLIVELDVHSSNASVNSYFSSTNPSIPGPTTRIWSPADTAADGHVGVGYGLVTQFGYAPNPDVYAFSLNAGESATLTATSLGVGAVQMTLLDSNGNPLALGISGQGDNSSSITDFVASASGTYYVQLAGDANVAYSLVVNRSSELDSQGNNSLATAQDLVSPEAAAGRWVTGDIRPLSELYATGNNGSELININKNTGAGAVVGPFGAYATYATAFTPDGTLWTITGAFGAASRLATVDLTTGQATPVGSPDWTGTPVQAMDADAQGNLYAGGWDGRFFSVNKTTGQLTLIGHMGIQNITDFAFDNNGVLWAVDYLNRLFTIDPQTGVGTYRTFVTGLNGTITGLMVDPIDDALYAITFAYSSKLYRIDPATGVATEVGPVGICDPREGDFSPPHASSEFYKITALDSTPIEAETQTPAGLSGEFTDKLDPMLRLYDAAGNLVATNDNGAPDGRNALLDYNVPAGKGGVYYIEVTASTATAQLTSGEYVLSVMGATGALPPFQVTSTQPAGGESLGTPPSQITANFNQGILLPTLQGSDLTVDGVAAADATATDGATAVFGDRSAFQWSAASGGNGHYYLQTSNAETWTAAEAEAEAMGGHLVAVNSQAEENFLVQRFMTRQNAKTIYWNGLNDQATEGDFVWTTGEPVSYTDWHPGEPNDYPGTGSHNEDYVAMNWAYGSGTAGISARGDWNDTTNDDGGRLHYGIIELDALPAGYWAATDGSHTIGIAAGAINDVSGVGNDAYSGNFKLDLTPPQIVSSSLQENEVVSYSGSLISNLSYTVGFSEPMNTATVNGSAFALYGNDRRASYIPSSFLWSADGKSLTLNYYNLPDDAYTLTLRSSAFQDLVGWQLDGERPTGAISAANPSGDGVEGGDFVLDFVTHFTTAPYPGPLAPQAPLGSLVYDPSVTAVIGAAGLSDGLTLSLYAGQTITVSVRPQTSGLEPAVSVTGPDGTSLGSVTAAAPGSNVVLETIAASADGVYTFSVDGAGGTTGLFTAELTLNSALQLPSNHSAATAQDIGPSFLPLPKGASRGAVAGDFSGTSDYYSFHLDAGDTASLGLKLAGASQGNAQTFGSPSSIYSGALNGNSVAAGDVNGDGKQDLVVLSSGYNPTVSVLLGRGDGTFSLAGSYSVGGHYGQAVILTDLRGMGRPDIVVVTQYNAYNNLGGMFVLPNNGNGTFGSGVEYVTGDFASAVAAGDVNGDGRPDVVVVNEFSNSVYVYLGDGTGALGAPTSYYVGFAPVGVALADLRGNGKLDIVVSNTFGNVTVLLNNGSGVFSTGGSYATGGWGTKGIAVADLGNGHPDIIAANEFSSSVAVLMGNGGGTFGAAADYRTDSDPLSLAVADLNGDGRPDVVTANYFSTASVLLNNGDGTLGAYKNYDLGFSSHIGSQDLALADFNGDGLPDLAAANFFNSAVSVLLNVSGQINLRLLGPDGVTVLATGADGAGNVDSFIHNFQAPLSGTYYALISGAGGSRNYQLVVTRNADFDAKSNGNPAQAQDISGTAGALGYYDASKGPEWFAVQLVAGQTYSFPTSTPAVGGAGLYTNALIPQIDLYDAAGGTLLASGVKLADGRNETITFTPTTSGVYLIRLTSLERTSGEFFLDPAGTVIAVPGGLAQANSPLAGRASVNLSASPSVSASVSHAVSASSTISIPAPFMFPIADAEAGAMPVVVSSFGVPRMSAQGQVPKARDQNQQAPRDKNRPASPSLPGTGERRADDSSPKMPQQAASDLCFREEAWLSELGEEFQDMSLMPDGAGSEEATAWVVATLALAFVQSRRSQSDMNQRCHSSPAIGKHLKHEPV